jgi:hypothetical protein
VWRIVTGAAGQGGSTALASTEDIAKEVDIHRLFFVHRFELAHSIQ